MVKAILDVKMAARLLDTLAKRPIILSFKAWVVSSIGRASDS
jgi:hypothetical protein